MVTPLQRKRLQNLIARYQSGKATDAEARFVERYYDWFEQLPDVTDKDTPEAQDEIGQRMKKKILQGILEEERRLHRGGYRRMIFRWAAAAVLVTAVSTSAYILWTTRSHIGPSVLGQHPADIQPPANNKSVLTLADGKQIVLDSAGTGLLAAQGSSQVMRAASGSIAYELTGRAAPLQYNTLSVPRGSQIAALVLSDGTKVWLNAGSSLRFPVAFGKDKREVEMSGEIYFEVAKDGQRPFFVNRKGQETAVKVLGTSFNMNAFDDERLIRVTLLDGSVKVTNNGRTQLLTPGQQAEVTQDGAISIAAHVSVPEVMAWKNGLFSFESADVAGIMRQLSRWYDLEVRYENSDLMEKHFTGNMPRGANVSEVLHMLELTGVIHFSIDGRTVTIRK